MPRPDKLQEIHKLKRDMIFLKASVWLLRKLINGLERGENLRLLTLTIFLSIVKTINKLTDS